MTSIRPRKHEDDHAAEPKVETEIGMLVRRGLAQGRNSQAQDRSEAVSNINSVIDRVSGATVVEIEGLINQLQGIRDHLRQEAERVQHEIAQYAQMSRTAAQSTKVMAETLLQWKR
jgi:ABC-type transporter Mla subunit MlaD